MRWSVTVAAEGDRVMVRRSSSWPTRSPRTAGSRPASAPAVYAIMYRPEAETRPDRYAVIYVGHYDDPASERFPFGHPRASCWIRRAGSKWKLHVCTYEVPDGLPSHREQITQELGAVYRPGCNERAYEPSWRQEWIGEYSAPATGPLTTDRDPGDPRPR